MNKTVVIHQPDFLPYLGFFHRFLHADLWVMLDNVQFLQHSSKGWHHRDKIKTLNGERWISMSVQKCHMDTAINEVLLSKNVKWKETHLNLISHNYKKAAFFEEVFPHIEKLYLFECDKMVDFNIKSISMIMELFGITIPSICAGTLKPAGKKSELLVDILQTVEGSKYLSGIGAKNYLDEKLLNDTGIEVIWQNFRHPTYPQLHGDFIPYLSSIDILLNCGIEKSREILRRC